MKIVFLFTAFITPYLFALAGVPKADYQIKGSMPLPKDCFTQGLVFHKQHFYVSCGHYGKSRIIKLNKTGTVLKEKRMDKNTFLEGITLFQDKLYALTWKSNTLFVINPQTLDIEEKKTLKGEGWGLTHIGKQLIKSNGSSHLDTLDSQLKKQGSISLQDIQKRPILELNAMTAVGELLIINVWKTNALLFVPFIPNKALIPSLWLDLSPLNDTWSFRWTGITANGIAFDPSTQCLWVTGKKWGKAYALSLQIPQPLLTLTKIEFSCHM